MTTPPEKPGQFNLQALMMGIGALVVVFLTILVAIFLASKDTTGDDRPADQETPAIRPDTPTTIPATATSTEVVPVATQTGTATPSIGATATANQPTVTPTATALSHTPTATSTQCAVRTDWPVYVVQEGDTLSSIASRVNTTADQLRAANCLPTDIIFVDHQLRVPQLPATSTPTASPTPTNTVSPTTDTPTITATPPDIDLGTPTPTLTPGPSVELPTPTDTPETDPDATTTATPPP